ncbi:hypothetical protein WISP_104066 [Willisornis vidua]|uniref:Uncharacterized protein n=1 Tax=Willisornis vidua TaxID=1566151 RepID=A0ABQ9D2W0_9PASS|nr:hypothetical protein WISP_104066 [Willisornis vidua]
MKLSWVGVLICWRAGGRLCRGIWTGWIHGLRPAQWEVNKTKCWVLRLGHHNALQLQAGAEGLERCPEERTWQCRLTVAEHESRCGVVAKRHVVCTSTGVAIGPEIIQDFKISPIFYHSQKPQLLEQSQSKEQCTPSNSQSMYLRKRSPVLYDYQESNMSSIIMSAWKPDTHEVPPAKQFSKVSLSQEPGPALTVKDSSRQRCFSKLRNIQSEERVQKQGNISTQAPGMAPDDSSGGVTISMEP